MIFFFYLNAACGEFLKWPLHHSSGFLCQADWWHSNTSYRGVCISSCETSCHLLVLYQNHSCASRWPIPRGFPGFCMISGCNSIRVDVNISLVHKYQSGIEVFRHSTAVPCLSGASCPRHCCSGTGCGQRPVQGAGSSATHLSPSPQHLFTSSPCTQKPTTKTSVACLSKTEHSLAHGEKGVGKLCHSAIWRYLPKPYHWQGLWPPRRLIHRRMLSPGPWFTRREMPVRHKACVSGGFCTTLWVALIKDPVFSANLPFLAGSADPLICILGLGHKSKDWQKKSHMCELFVVKIRSCEGVVCFFLSSCSYFCLSTFGLRRFFFPVHLSEYSFGLLCCLGLLFSFIWGRNRIPYWIRVYVRSLRDLSVLRILLFSPHPLNTKM